MENMTNVRFHYHANGDRELNALLHKLLKQIENTDAEASGMVAIDDSVYSNVAIYKTHKDVAETIREIYKYQFIMIKNAEKEGKSKGLDLLGMLNNNEITTEDFLRRSK